MNRRSIVVAHAVLTALATGCGPQATEEYYGEPLLRMRGQVTTSGLTIAQPITPALCFTQIVPGTWNVEALPPEISSAFEGIGFGAGRTVAHVLDVEVEGSFPAEFKVNVYAPPPAAAIKPLFTGEPPAAWGWVCAVQVEHKAVAEAVYGTQLRTCDPDGSCRQINIVMTESGSRYYAESFDCLAAQAEDTECGVTRYGDVSMLTEMGGFEHVAAIAWDPELVYLAAPAPPGSYTAYKLGAPEGLPAGYHLRKGWVSYEDPVKQEQWSNAQIAAHEGAVAQTNAIHGTSFQSLPDYPDEDGFHFAPDDVVDTYHRLHARLEMETIETPLRSSVTPDDPGLTLELVESENWLDRFEMTPPLFDAP